MAHSLLLPLLVAALHTQAFLLSVTNAAGVDTSKWFHQTQLPNGVGWYNNELQHYTDREANAKVEGGTLKIIAKKESFTDQSQTKQYTSARLNSKFAFTYGKVEVRAKLPTGAKTWPAIWMLGKNIDEPGAYWKKEGFGTTSWPACGEIDIMEHWGTNQNYVASAMHTPSSYGGTINHGGQVISTASSEFHTYGLVWTSEQMVFTVDGVEHYRYNPPTKNDATWPFDAEQYLLLNVAIEAGASLPSGWESAMEIDYVRVYQPQNDGSCDLVWRDEFGDPEENIDGDCALPEVPEAGPCDTDCEFSGQTYSCRDRVIYTIQSQTWTGALDTVATDCAPICSCDCDDFVDGETDKNGQTCVEDDSNGGSTTGGDSGSSGGGAPQFSGIFGGVSNAEGSEGSMSYMFPTGVEEWAGWANENAGVYPLQFKEEGSITFDAKVPAADTTVRIKFRFENEPYPNVEYAFETAVVEVTGTDFTSYSVDVVRPDNIPEAQTFSSFLLYVVDRDKSVELKNFQVNDDSSEVNEVAGNFDFDQNEQADALTDGLLALRYLFGLTGASLTDGAISSGSGLSAQEVENNLAAAAGSFLDIDGNGSSDALTDGLMLLRYLFGLRGDNLISSAVAAGATRSNAADIEAYIESLLPEV